MYTKCSKALYVLFLVWLIWQMFSLSFLTAIPEKQHMITKEFRGAIKETEAGLQFELDSFSSIDREPLVITEQTIWTGKEIETRLKNCETGLVVQVWVEYQQGTVEDERYGPFPVLDFCEFQLEIPLLQYDSIQGTLYGAKWNFNRQVLTTEETVLLQQQNIGAMLRVEWNGDNHIILPKVSSNTTFPEINRAFFGKVTEKEYDNEAFYGDWRCYRTDNNTLTLAADNNIYSLGIDSAYEIGNLEQLEGFSHLMSSQLYPEQVAVETENGFYFTDGFEVYWIDSKTKQVKLVFSKNKFADSFADAELTEALKSCNFRMEIYQNELLLLFGNPEGLLDKQWLYYQTEEQQELIELPADTAIYLLPNHI